MVWLATHSRKQTSLSQHSKEGYGLKRVALPMMMMIKIKKQMVKRRNSGKETQKVVQ
jgi:hypothetical protein